MANLMRNNLMKNHYSALVHVKSDIGKYMNKKPPLHIKAKVRKGRQQALAASRMQAAPKEQPRRPQSAYTEVMDLRKPKSKTDGVLDQLANQSYRLDRPRRKSTKFMYKDPPKYSAKERMLHHELLDPKFYEQREVQRRVANVKASDDWSKPKTFGRAAAMSHHRQLKASQHEKTEHLREMNSLKQRINAVGTWQHRKKNTQDPLANPVWFFKGKNRDPDSEKLLSLGTFEQRLKEQTRKEKAETEKLYKEIEEEMLAEHVKKDKLRQEVKRNAEAAKRQKEAALKERGLKPPDNVTAMEDCHFKPWNEFSQKKLRQQYQGTWKQQIITQGAGEAGRVDYQKLSDDIRPADTIYKSRVKTDYMKSKDERDDEED